MARMNHEKARRRDLARKSAHRTSAPRVIQAKYAGRCRECSDDIAPGQRIVWSKTQLHGTWTAHAACIPLAIYGG